jgi:hypothetical protein
MHTSAFLILTLVALVMLQLLPPVQSFLLFDHGSFGELEQRPRLNCSWKIGGNVYDYSYLAGEYVLSDDKGDKYRFR